MVLNKRLFRLVLNRLLHLPKGKYFLKYFVNNCKFHCALKRRNVILPHPNSLMIEITNLCQLKCIICAREYSLGKRMDKGNMNLEYAKKLIDDTHVYLDRIGLTGLGEPLLYPHLIEFVNYIRSKNKGLSIFLSTNAQHPKTPEIIEAVSDKINTLQVSVDGIGNVFEEIRVQGSYSIFLKNLEAISDITRDKKCDVKFNMVVLEKNYHQMTDIVRLAKRTGISEVYFMIINLVATEWDLSQYGFYHSDTFQEELRKTIQLAKNENIAISYPQTGIAHHFRDCPFPWNSFYITWDGFLVPCCAKPFPKVKHFGNVFKDGLMNCINHEEFIAFRTMSNENITPQFCKRCHMVV